jgi:hypothetical protein
MQPSFWNFGRPLGRLVSHLSNCIGARSRSSRAKSVALSMGVRSPLQSGRANPSGAKALISSRFYGPTKVVP